MKRALIGLVVLAALSAASVGGVVLSGAVFTATSASTQTASAVADFVPPVINVDPVIAKDGSTTPGFIKQGQGYRIYADVANDTGNPASGIASVTANVPNVTAAGSPVTLSSSGGPFVIGGHSYNYESAVLGSDDPLTEGSKSFSVTATDVAGNASAARNGSVTIDNSGPTVTSIVAKTPNGPGGGMHAGDTYYVFANATDVSPIDTVTADISSISPAETTPTSKTLSTCTGAANCTVGGTLYAYRAGPFASDATLSEGSVPFSVTASDLPGNSTTHPDTVAIDNTIPVVNGATIQKTQGGIGGQVKQAGTYFILANVTDTSQVTVTADVSSITNGATAVPLTTCSTGCTVDGVTYGYKSASTTVANPKAAASYNFSVTATDAATNVGNGGPFSVTVDNTAPVATGIQAANHTGGTVSAPDIGDTLTLTTGELIDPNSVLAGWDGTSINVVVRAHTQGNKTDFQIWNSTNTTRLNLGNIATGSKFTANNGDATFGATGTASTLVATSSSPFTFTLTLGTAGGSAILADTGTNNMAWQPATGTPGATDAAGNALSASVTETDNDTDF